MTTKEIKVRNKLNYSDEVLQKEWSEVEDKITLFQNQFKETATQEDIGIASEASIFLIDKFNPLFKKYITLFKYGQIDFDDFEMKQFVSLFMDDYSLKKALNRKKQSTPFRKDIYKKFNFILETYGAVNEEDILNDLHICFLIMAKRYKPVGKNFCAYLYNCFRYEVARHIKSFIKNPINVPYKLLQYEDCLNGDDEIFLHVDNYHEDNEGLPDHTWVTGKSCSDIFSCLSALQRKILVKYYLEDWNDRQIAEATGLHINTINNKRREAIKIVADRTNVDLSTLKHKRKSGKKASLSI